MCDTSNGLEELNLTELREIYYDRHHHRISAEIPRPALILALQDGKPLDAPDPIEYMRDSLVRLIDCHWKRVRSQIPCDGVCFVCPDGQVLDCYKDNVRLMNGEEAMRTTLNSSEATLGQILADEKAREDKTFLLKVCIANKLAGLKNLMDKDAEELLEIIKAKMGSDDAGEASETGSKKEGDKKAAKKGKVLKGKFKKGKDKKDKDKNENTKEDDDNEPRFQPVDDEPDDRLTPLLDMVPDLQRARDLANKYASTYMSAFETMVQDVEIMKTMLSVVVEKLDDLVEAVVEDEDPSEDD